MVALLAESMSELAARVTMPHKAMCGKHHLCLYIWCLMCNAVVVEGDNLYFSKKADQLDLLAQVLMAGEDEAGEEADTVQDDVSKTAKAVARRTAGSMSKISGATGNYYMEFGTGEKAIAQYGRGQGSKRGRPDAPKAKPVNKQSLTYKYNR